MVVVVIELGSGIGALGAAMSEPLVTFEFSLPGVGIGPRKSPPTVADGSILEELWASRPRHFAERNALRWGERRTDICWSYRAYGRSICYRLPSIAVTNRRKTGLSQQSAEHREENRSIVKN